MRLVAAVAVLLCCLLWLGSRGDGTTFVPACWEDEVILVNGECHPQDDSYHVNGYWYPRGVPATMEV